MNPADSRNGTNRNTVRIFGPDKLSKPAALEKWDRVKIVCAQPFNKVEKHCFKVIVSFFNFKMCNDTALLFTERCKSTCSCIGMSCLFLFLVFLNQYNLSFQTSTYGLSFIKFHSPPDTNKPTEVNFFFHLDLH